MIVEKIYVKPKGNSLFEQSNNSENGGTPIYISDTKCTQQEAKEFYESNNKQQWENQHQNKK